MELPVYIYDEKAGSTIQVYSDKQQRVCYRCLGKGHIAAFCRKALKTQATAIGTTSWASIAAGSPKVPVSNGVVTPPEVPTGPGEEISVPNPRTAGPVGGQASVESEESMDEVGSMEKEEGSEDSSALGHEESEDDGEGDYTVVGSRKRLGSKKGVVGRKPRTQVVEDMPQVAEEDRNKQLMLELDEKKRRIQEKL